VTACNSPDGLARATQICPAAVPTAVHLPGMDGLQVLRALRADPRLAGVPGLAQSADAMPEQVQHALAAGFDAYLTKPVDMRRQVDTLAACPWPGRRTRSRRPEDGPSGTVPPRRRGQGSRYIVSPAAAGGLPTLARHPGGGRPMPPPARSVLPRRPA